MRIRLYSLPSWAGLHDVGFSLYISYVFASGADVGSRSANYDAPYWQSLPANVMGFPRFDEIFTVEGVNRNRLQSGDEIQLRTSGGRFVGIDHDEENRYDSIVANETQPGLSETFLVTILDDPSSSVTQELSSLTGLDPCGPSQAVTFLGRNQNFLSFSPDGDDGPLDIGGNAVGDRQTFALDYLPNLPNPLPRKRRWRGQ